MRFLIFALIIYLAYRVLKSRLGSFQQGGEDQDETSLQNTELIQDPQCGTYFLRQRGIGARIKGREVYFCSENCRDDYLKEHRHD